MRMLAVGTMLFGLVCLGAAGCDEVSSGSGQSVGQLSGNTDTNDGNVNGGDAKDGEAKDGQSKGGQSKGGKAKDGDADAEAGKNGGVTEQPKADAPNVAGDAADDAASPSEIVHFAPQQVATGGDGKARNITFDNIKFEMEDPKSRQFKRSMLTESIETLSGNRVRIRGFILPGALEEFSHFVLVRDNQECCFGPGSAIYDSIMVDMCEDETVKFSTRPVTVEGTFEIKELIGPDDRHWSIYRITATNVE